MNASDIYGDSGNYAPGPGPRAFAGAQPRGSVEAATIYIDPIHSNVFASENSAEKIILFPIPD